MSIYAWVCDGVSTIFVTDEGLDDAWAVTQGFTRTHAGLQAPSGLSAVIDLRELVPQSVRLEVGADRAAKHGGQTYGIVSPNMFIDRVAPDTPAAINSRSR